MVRHTKNFKKGGFAKKVLSAILAASMIMTSSAMVMAAPEESFSAGNDVAVESFSAGEEAETADTPELFAAETVEDLTVALESDSLQYDGEEKKPKVTITDTSNDNAELKEGEDFTVTYYNNVNVPASNASEDEVPYAVISFMGDTYGTLQNIRKDFTIIPASISGAVVEWGIVDAFPYNGEEQYPSVESVKVTLGDDEVTLGAEDYEVVAGASKDMKSAGEQSVKIKGKGNFNGESPEKTYTIDQVELSNEMVNVDVKEVIYTRNMTVEDVKDRVTVKENATDAKLTYGSTADYTLQFEKDGEWGTTPDENIGTHKMRVVATGQKNYTANSYVETEYTVVSDTSLAVKAEEAKVAGFTNGEAAYTGNDLFPEKVEISGLTEGKDYKVLTEKAEWVNVGEYSIEIEGLNLYAGQKATIPLKITPKAMNTNGTTAASGIEVSATQGKHTSGSMADINVKVTDENRKAEEQTLVEGVDYTYAVVTEGDKTFVNIAGIGNYTTEWKDGDVLKVEVKTSEELSLEDASISAEVVTPYKWTGSQVKPQMADIEVVEHDTTDHKLTSDDFSIKEYGENTNAGEGTVVIQAKKGSGYSGERTIKFKIEGTSFAETFKLDEIKDVEATGGNLADTIKKAVKVRYVETNGIYQSGYNVEFYLDDKKVDKVEKGGVYTVKVTPKPGRYEGELSTTVTVLGESIVGKVDVAAIADQVYTGEAITPDVKVSEKDGGKKVLEKDKDYTLSYDENVNAGTAYVTIKGIGEYSGEIIESFNITKGEQKLTLDEAQVRGLKNRTSLNKDCVMRLTSALKDEKQELTYASSDEKVATVKDGVIHYEGVGTAIITVTSPETDNCKATELKVEVNVTKPGKPSFTPTVSSKTAKKTITVTSSTVRGADGWEVEYAIKSNWAGSRTATFTNVGTKLYRKSIKTMQSNKKYYIRVRAFQTVDGKKVYSSWSAVKTAKTK